MHLIYTDYRRYRATGAGQGHFLSIIFLVQGFWASSVYRLAHWVHTQVKLPGLRQILRLGFIFLQKWIEILTGISLPAETEVGEGLYMGHFGALIVSGRAKIGANCNLSQGVTIGILQRGERQGAPTLGNRVYVGPNAVIIGSITIGDDAAIGAGAVVTRSVPPRAVLAGNPAKIISLKGSFELVRYDGMETDPERNASLNARQAADATKVSTNA